MQSLYIALEGVDGTGKSTVSALVLQRLLRSGLRAQLKPEFPAHMLEAEFRSALTRSLFLADELGTSRQAAFFYLLYAEAFAVANVDFHDNQVVVADRCHYSQSMYQAYFASSPSRFDARAVRQLIERLYFILGTPIPARVFILKTPESVYLDRLQTRECREITEREKQVLRVFGKIYDDYGRDPGALVIDADRPPDDIADEVFDLILPWAEVGVGDG
jgi:dTMP kinase